MQSSFAKITVALLAVAACTSPTQAADQVADPGAAPEAKQPGRKLLNIGDAAPKLAPGERVQGEPVKAFAGDKIYIVEFWATWCGTRKVSIPHLNELHEQFKDKGVVVIGQDCWERDDSLGLRVDS